MPQLDLFDCNCTVGRRATPRPENNLSVDGLADELERCGIARALCVHGYARDYDPATGNRMVSDLAASQDRFIPCYVVVPHFTGEMPGGDDLLRYLADGGARAVRLCPADQNYGLGETWSGPLLATLAEAGVPVFIDLDQTDWRELDGVLAAHPGLNLTVLRVGYRINRWLYPMLAKYPGLRIESGFYTLHRGIETTTRRFGPDRILFGSGLPVWNAGAAVAAVQYAEVDDESRRQIAGETLAGLLWQGA